MTNQWGTKCTQLALKQDCDVTVDAYWFTHGHRDTLNLGCTIKKDRQSSEWVSHWAFSYEVLLIMSSGWFSALLIWWFELNPTLCRHLKKPFVRLWYKVVAKHMYSTVKCLNLQAYCIWFVSAWVQKQHCTLAFTQSKHHQACMYFI